MAPSSNRADTRTLGLGLPDRDGDRGKSATSSIGLTTVYLTAIVS